MRGVIGVKIFSTAFDDSNNMRFARVGNIIESQTIVENV